MTNNALTNNAYFYTYSTIAQTLAGAFGFLVAVVLYRLQMLNNSLRNHAMQLVIVCLRITIRKKIGSIEGNG